MTAHDPATLNFYASSAEDYTARLPEGINCDLPRFLDHLPAGASVLELGCGAGRDAAYMLQRGFRVDPTDGCARHGRTGPAAAWPAGAGHAV